ncbi:MAG: AMP-binding protein [Streptomyces sp.]|nr:AMP-binding protein [Streptomyces sp.]NUR43319.1 AMP-binding protein [Streptomyces sp.]NUS10502.1 AMP-binding protein [Streptomyces sp.]NUS28430.1 AMP-binding protein [Streptomyces sp.]NUS80107.1 AMP-binding protein [Streptomyces sp.]
MPSPHLADTVGAHREKRADRVALSCCHRSVTYRQLDVLTSALADQLDRLELAPGATVCVPAHKSPETVALLLAVFRRGLVALVPSPDLGVEALARLSRQARAVHLLAVDEQGRLSAEPLPRDETEAAGFAIPDPARTRLLLTTSGSTGTPKIVPVPVDGFTAFADWATHAFDLTADDVALSYAPLNFDLALLDVWTFLRLGAEVVLVGKEQAADAGRLADLVSGRHITFVQGVPMLHRLLAQGPSRPTVRQAVFTGEAMPADLLPSVFAAYPEARFHNVFGCTETNDSFVHEVPRTPGRPERMPIGHPLPGVRALVLAPDGTPLDGPGTGELVVSTPFQTDGYLRTALNDRAFTELDGHTYYRTGDLVTRAPDGLVHLEGRADWQVKVRGIRTNLQEVEAVITTHPDVSEAVVVALPDDQAGARLHARVTRHPAAALTGLGLRSHVGARLPRHAIPSSVHITDQPLPRTSTGKPDRNRIRDDRMKETATA